MRYLLTGLLLIVCAVAQAAEPFDSVGRVITRRSGGSGTLVYTNGDVAVVLGARHVSPRVGEWVSIRWPNGERSEGTCWIVHPRSDICAMKVTAPQNVAPVRISLPESDDTFVAAGYPSYGKGKLHYQVGQFYRKSSDTVYWDKAPWSGMSGGALFSMKYGTLVGVVVTAHPSIQNGTYGGATSYEALEWVVREVNRRP